MCIYIYIYIYTHTHLPVQLTILHFYITYLLHMLHLRVHLWCFRNAQLTFLHFPPAHVSWPLGPLPHALTPSS